MSQVVVACVLVPARWRQRQVDLCEFKVSLVNSVRSRTVRVVTQRNSVFKNCDMSIAYLLYSYMKPTTLYS